jgi:adenylate cyclase
VERCEELEHVCRRLIDSFNRLDADAYADMWHDSVALLIGSDAEEWWTRSDEIKSLIHAQFEAMNAADLWADISWDLEEVHGWSAGDIGWVAARCSIRSGDQPSTTVRLTAVFVLERGAWRLTHLHLSYAVPNEAELPTSIEQLLEAVTQERPELSPGTTPSGPVTVAFTDIESSTELAVTMGDMAWFDLLQRHDEVLASCMARRRGSVVKTIGDGAMLVFESGAEALIYARELRESFASEPRLADLGVRIGVHGGDAIHHGDDFYGTTVNVAARVAGAATGNQTLVSSSVRDDVADDERFTLRHAGAYEFKGVAGTHDLYEFD